MTSFKNAQGSFSKIKRRRRQDGHANFPDFRSTWIDIGIWRNQRLSGKKRQPTKRGRREREPAEEECRERHGRCTANLKSGYGDRD